jgi:hypothetical protein
MGKSRYLIHGEQASQVVVPVNVLISAWAEDVNTIIDE